VIDGIVPEPLDGAQADPDMAAALLKDALCVHLDELVAVPADELRRRRRAKFRTMGVVA
jgi:acetyl-CoA carboxylase carboxyl transferase subunit alpha